VIVDTSARVVGPAQQRGLQRQLDEWCQASMARAELCPAAYIRDKAYLYTGLRPLGGDSPSALPAHVGGHSNWRTAAPTVIFFYFAAIYTNLPQDDPPASTHAQLIHF